MIRRISQSLIGISTFLIPFYIFRFDISLFKTNIFEIAVLLSLIACLLQIIKEQNMPKFGSIWLYLFVLAAILAVVFADDKLKALGILKGWFLIPLCYFFTVINSFDIQDYKKLTIPLFCSLLLVSLWAVLQKLGLLQALFYQTQLPELDQYFLAPRRVIGPFDSPNFLAMYILPVAFLTIPIVTFIKTKKARICFFLLYLLPATALLFSGSRSSIIALAAVLIVPTVLYVYKSGNTLLKVGGILTTLVFVGLTVFMVLNPGSRIGSNEARLDIYHYSLQMIGDNWLKGIGLGSYFQVISEFAQDNPSFLKYVLPYALHPHNIFLAMWLNLGLLGLVAFLIIVFRFFIGLAKSYLLENKKASLAPAMAMTAILIHGLFDTTYYKNDLSAVFWLILGFALIIRENNIRSDVAA